MPYTHEGAPLYLNADKSKVVKDGDPEAAYLLVSDGGQLSDEDAAKYGLTNEAAPKRDQDAPEGEATPKAAQGGAQNKLRTTSPAQSKVAGDEPKKGR